MRHVVEAVVCPNNPINCDRIPFVDHRVTVMLEDSSMETVCVKAFNPEDAKAVVMTMPKEQYEQLDRMEDLAYA